MDLATKSLIVAGTGITCADGVNLSVSAAYQALINNAEQVAMKGQPNGYVGIDANGVAGAIIIIRYGTAAAIEALVLDVGELAWKTDTEELVIGDDVTAGGIPVLPSVPGSTSTIELDATGTPTQNGQALVDAYTAAKLLTPNSAALSTYNRATIVLHPGVYTHSGLTLDSAFVDIIGTKGSQSVSVINTGAFEINNAGMTLKGIRFAGNNAGTPAACGVTFRTVNNPVNYWEDLFFDTYGSTTDNAMSMFSGGTIGGIYRKIKSPGQRFLGNVTSISSVTTTLFEDCEVGTASLLSGTSITGTSPGNLLGTMRRCILTGSTWHCKVGATGKVFDCEFRGVGMLRWVTGAIVDNTLILPASGTCIGNTADTATITASRMRLKTFSAATPYGANITNALGNTSALTNMNIHSDVMV